MGLISLVRLNILKERVLDTIKEYQTLLESLDYSFKNNNSEQIEHLLKLEGEVLNKLRQRVKILKSHVKYLNKSNVSTFKIENEVNDNLRILNKKLDSFSKQLVLDKVALSTEIANVKRIVKPLGRAKEFIAQRIDIIT